MCKYDYKEKIKNVFYAFDDPDKRTFKKQKNFLEENIQAKIVCSKKYSNFYKSYFKRNYLFHI